MVIFLRDGVLGREPDVLLGVERVIEAAPRKALDACIEVVHALHHSRIREFMNELSRLSAVGGRVDKFDLPRSGHDHLGILVNIAVSMTRYGDGLFPAAHNRLDALHENRRAKHCAIQHRANSPVRALPHLLQAVFLDARSVRRNRRALDGNAQPFRRFSRFDGDGIIGCIAVREAKVEVFGLQINVRANQALFDEPPDYTRHFVAVHFDERRFHLNLGHFSPRIGPYGHGIWRCASESPPSIGPTRMLMKVL